MEVDYEFAPPLLTAARDFEAPHDDDGAAASLEQQFAHTVSSLMRDEESPAQAVQAFYEASMAEVAHLRWVGVPARPHIEG